MSFIGELKRRNVFRIAGLYAVVSWLLVQIAASLEEAVGLPVWFDGFVVSLLAIGFPIALVIAWAFEVTPEGIKPTSSIDANESITAQTGSKLDVVLVISLLIFAGAMLAPRFFDTDQLPGPITGSSAAQASIAVLPFADMSADGDQEYFADGVSEELLNVLAKVDGMKVAGRTSSFSFKGRNEDLREIGRILDVEHILEGSVRSQGNKIRVTAQLIQVSDGFHLWSETYDGDLSDIFAVQDEIANSILLAMMTQLNVEEALTIAPAQRTDTTAYGLFLEARDLIYTRDPQGMERALDLLNRAIDIDPAYAPAYASRAKALFLLADRHYGQLPSVDAFERATADVAQALALDSELADGYSVRGQLHIESDQMDNAIADLRRAIDLNPNSLDARAWLSQALNKEGRHGEHVAQLKALIEVDPLYSTAVNNVVQFSIITGDHETARRVAERYIAASQDTTQKVRLGAKLLKLDGQIAESIKLRQTLPDSVLESTYRFGVLVGDYHHLGLFDEYTGPAQIPPFTIPFERLNRGDYRDALMTARAAAATSSNPSMHAVYMSVLFELGQDRELVDFFKREYNARFEDWMASLAIVTALRSVGELEQAQYEEAEQRERFKLDIQRARGNVTSELDTQEAEYWAAKGDTDKALGLLEQAFDKAAPLSFGLFMRRAADPVRQEPRFIALRDANLERVNQEREILGYPSLNITLYDQYQRWCDESPHCSRAAMN